MSVVRKLEPLEPSVPGRRVAAYARVSRKTDALVNSLSAQVDYFTSVIKANPNWEFAGIYADPWVTGTSIGPRREFQRLMEDCRGGKIDLVLTKSISRFARNTVELLSAVRELKTLGVEVRFETEKISTRSGEGELMLTLLAALAEEESRSLSGNVRWAIDRRYQEGRPFAHQKLFGYRWRGDELEPVPQEAELVKAVFDAYTQGKGVAEIEKELGEQGRRAGRPLTRSGIWAILRNEQYTGCLLLRQSFNEKPRKRKRNRGERTMYLIEEHHPAIVTREQFQRAEERRRKRRPASSSASPFCGKIWCGECGHRAFPYRSGHARRTGDRTRFSWRCGKKARNQKCGCKNLGNRELLETIFALDLDAEELVRIEMFDESLKLYLNDGREKLWKRSG